jgi:hypothetical protein
MKLGLNIIEVNVMLIQKIVYFDFDSKKRKSI